MTSDKSTLHVFDLPHPHKAPRSIAEHNKPIPAHASGSAYGATDDNISQKWGILSKIPLLPRVFSDVYSFASAHFEIGDEPISAGILSGRPPKGVLGWINDQTIIVISAGKDARWEKFVVIEGEDGRSYCIRDGWRRYLGAS